MFSRTTMASSISMPMASESAINVMMLSVKPKAVIAMKRRRSPRSAASRPVITVLRQELQEQEHDQRWSATPPSIMSP